MTGGFRRKIATVLSAFWNTNPPQTLDSAGVIPPPVTPGVAGSSPVHSAKLFKQSAI